MKWIVLDWRTMEVFGYFRDRETAREIACTFANHVYLPLTRWERVLIKLRLI